MKDENAVIKHTLGPWRTYNHGSRWIIATTSPWAYSAIGYLPTDEPEIEEANARLIAAAPDMLAALKAIKKELQLSGNWEARDYGWPENRKAIEAAIDKAEGR